MSKSRRVLGAVLAVMLVLNVFAVSAFAAGGTSYESNAADYSQTWQVVSAGTNKVNITLKTDYLTGPIQFKLSGCTVTAVTVGAGYYSNAKVEFNSQGLVLLVPDTTDTVEGKKIDGVVATVTYTGSTPTIENSPKTASVPNGTLIAARLTAGTVNDSDLVFGQTVTVSGSTGGGTTTTADLKLKSGAQEGILIDTQKTFGGAYAGVVYGFTGTTFKNATYIKNAVEATNGGSIEVYTSDNKTTNAGNYGTGSTVVVKNSDGTVSKTYAICIFGDVDGNGLINTNDVTAVKTCSGGDKSKNPDNSLVRLASNIQNVNNANIMHNVNTNDVTPLKNHSGGGTKFNPVALASRQFALNNNYQ